MRRYLAWNRSGRRWLCARVALLLVLLPGLLQTAALPAVAAAFSATSGAAATAQGIPETPRQRMGIGLKGLPAVMPAELTMAPGKAQEMLAPGKVRLPKQVNGPDTASRSQSTMSTAPAAQRLPSGVARAEAKDAATVAAALEVTSMWPLNGAMAGTVPTLLAHAEGGSEPLEFEYMLCEAPDDLEVLFESDYDLWCFRDNPDGSAYEPLYSGRLRSGAHAWTLWSGVLRPGATYAWRVTVTDDIGRRVTSAYHTFVTGARQPRIGSQLANRDQGGQEFQAVSGNYTSTVVDASVAGVGPPLSVVRTYNSMDARRDGLFGAGWSTRFDMRIVTEPGGSLLVTYPDGRRLRFAAKGDGTFQPPSGMHATLGVVSGGGWKLMDKSSTVYHFNAAGRLTQVADARGRAQELIYGADGKLTKVTGVGGRSLTFTWSGAHVGSVSTDAVDGAPLTWTYSYDGDKLVSACRPGAAPNCTTHAYSSGSQYRSLVEDGEPVGYWRLGEPATEDFWAESLGWGAGAGEYRDVALQQTGALAGTTDKAARFFGDSELVLPGHLTAQLHNQLSVELWFKTTSSGILAYTAAEEPDPDIAVDAGIPLLYVGTDGKLRGQFRTFNSRGVEIGSPITSSARVNNGQWHHAVLAGSGNTQTLYLDGTSVGSLTGRIDHNGMAYTSIGYGLTHDGWPASKPLDPEDWFYTAWGLDGHVDEVAFYDRGLGAAEVSDHYAARLAAPHLLAEVKLPSGRVWAQNVYDTDKDRLLTHTDEHGGQWKISALADNTASGFKTVTVTDPAGKNITQEHDSWRGYRLVSAKDQSGYKTSYEYDDEGYPLAVKDPNGIATITNYDERGNLLHSAQCRAGTATKLPLTCLGFSSGDPQPINHRWYSYDVNEDDEFDPRNDRVTAVRDGRSSSSTDNTYAITYEYNAYGEQTKQTTPATPDFPSGRSATTTYTDGSEPAVGGGTTPAGLVETSTDFKGSTTSYRYTAAGDLAEQTDPTGLVTTSERDALGRVVTQTAISDAHPDGVKTSYTYDAAGWLATQTAPGVKNEVTNVTHTARTTYTYDPDGHTLSETVTDLTGGDPARTTTNTYDAHGRKETTTDAEGGVVRVTWNTLGQQSTVTDQLGATYSLSYSERGQLKKTTLQNWTGSPVDPQPATAIDLEELVYDPAGRLSAGVDAMGRRTTYSYYDHGLPYRTTAESVRLNGSDTVTNVVLEENVYDAAGHLTRKSTGDGAVTTDYVYDAAGRLTSTTLDPAELKRKTSYTYDANNLTTNETRSAANGSRQESTSYTYNAVGIKTRQTIENGDQDLITTWTVDDRGLVTAVTDPRGNADGAAAADYTVTNRYDALGRLVEIKAPQVQVDRNGTTTSTHPTTLTGYDTVGNATHKRDAEGRTTIASFDKVGRLTNSTAPAYTPPGGSPITPTVEHAYDAAGQLIRTTDPRDNVTSYEYDQLGRQVRVTDPAPEGQPPGRWIAEYNLAGEQTTIVDPTGARAQATYDGLGRQITTTQIERKPSSAVYTAELEYDVAGRLVKQTVPGPGTGTVVTSFEVNAAGETTKVIDPAGTTTTTYDLAGRPVMTADANRNGSVVEYDLAGRKIKVSDVRLQTDGVTVAEVLRTSSTDYDAAGNPTSATSPEGHVTRQTYDALNRLTSLIEPVSDSKQITTSFGYDATGARTRITDGRGNATWTSYNSLGLAETVTEPATAAHPNVADRTWTTLYDAAGNPTATIQPGGVRIDRTFDHLGRVTRETGGGGDAATAERSLGYDLAGRLISAGDLMVDYNDRGLPLSIKRDTIQETAYTYDALGNLTRRIDAAGATTFTYDDANRLKTATDPVTSRTLTYGYDPASRLKTITATSGTGSTQTIDYDDLDRVTGQTLRSGSGTQLAKITYGWDNDDNLTSKTTAGTAGAGTNTYGYDHAGRLTSWTASGGAAIDYEWDAAGNRTKAGDKTFTYDERNRLTRGDGTDYTYTSRGTLASQTKDGTTTPLTFDAFDRLIADGDSLYAYDAFDRVTSRISGTTRQTYLYAGLSNDLAAISVSGSIQAKYSRDAFGTLLGLQEGTAPAVAAMSDLHGDLVATHNGNALTSSTTYGPFGETTAHAGSESNLGYQGAYTDPDTGKVNMHARWYQPGTGTFTSRDTMTLEPSPSIQANRYTYANASPLTGIDPTGHATIAPGAASAWPGELEDLYNRNGPTGNRLGIGGCIACTNQVEPAILVMTEADIRRRGHLPNGGVIPPLFWEADKKSRAALIDFASRPNLSDDDILFAWGLLNGAFRNAAGKSAASKSLDPDKDRSYTVWWNGKRITFSSVGRALAYLNKMEADKEVDVCFDPRCIDEFGMWIRKTEKILQGGACGSKGMAASCVDDEARWKQEVGVRGLLLHFGFSGYSVMLWNGDTGVGYTGKEGGVYILVDRHGTPLKVGQTKDFATRQRQYNQEERCKKLGGCKVQVVFSLGSADERWGIEDVFFDIGSQLGYWRLGDEFNKQRPIELNHSERVERVSDGLLRLRTLGVGIRRPPEIPVAKGQTAYQVRLGGAGDGLYGRWGAAEGNPWRHPKALAGRIGGDIKRR
ncbi:RHS repeat-associated core domain-containing protein [Nonomuraea sp. NPDC049504]|uniref:RHS repeat-associated core domain-containing protein n=1 Tax=Nonomuraea sp. NPDC049504 TaxID=3154729 RepID=UPI0034308D1D